MKVGNAPGTHRVSEEGCWAAIMPQHTETLEATAGFPGGSEGKELACSAGHPGSIPGSGRSPVGAHGNPLQCSGLENPMDRGAWRAAVHGVERVGPAWGTNTSTS